MSYMQLFDKEVMEETFNTNQLINLLLDKKIYPIPSTTLLLNKRDILFDENQIHEYIYIVKSGLFSNWRKGHVISFTKQNEFIGVDSILGNEPSFFTVQALAKAEVWRFTKEDVMRKLMSTQEGVFYLYNEMKTNNEYLIQRNVYQMVETKERIMANMIQLAKRYGKEDTQHLILPKNLTKKIIANYLNITMTTMYYICKQLIQEGFLEPISHQLVMNKAVIKENKMLASLLK
ncbi:Crp/Fnr family transcriptional regulator [Listeria booriae]|uniref:Crp/Fnr family transcriptional regulator n=1 Tax=Listeria booriae TaxID=1552123 RepID=A0A7X1D5Z6_9LIST|nr:Crp/Fnr family transcriptional regulator [Listeria booriae]MBC2161745.1 Crp/Fnr family transcriptional regulator [Listeria booriae]MBC2167303.1 Crp/Fnr family transcriptional regulator [Listeria booriae]MBC2171358.1 Crp/Fnr family transcriptional regulator [Listeria booriae]MBC2173171.1 Crp/Fnr family transcriptional regulator [Listeria booriae]MBC2195720.1 Crp/Fnr family transcriptional regulator [Listeria booriae]